MSSTQTSPYTRPLSARYFTYPASMMGLTKSQREGLHALSAVATISAVSTFCVLCFLLYRAIFWKRYYSSTLVFNHYIVLLFNLLIGDLLTSSGYMIGWHWSRLDSILAPTRACDAQGLLLNIGDLVSGCFVFVIAVHTGVNLIWNHVIAWKHLVPIIVFCWSFGVVISSLGFAFFGRGYINDAGYYCWISPSHDHSQLWAHYAWVFLFEFGTLFIYVTTFVILRRRLVACRANMRSSISLMKFTTDTEGSIPPNHPHRGDGNFQQRNNRVTRATWFMIIYPIVYFVCTAPVAANRLYVISSGKRSPEWVYFFAACCLNCCGWIDCIVYTLTRHVFVKSILRG